MYWGKDLRKNVLSYDCKYLAELQKHNPFDIIPIENFTDIYTHTLKMPYVQGYSMQHCLQ